MNIGVSLFTYLSPKHFVMVLIITQNEVIAFKAFQVFLCIALVISFIYRDTPLGFLWHLFKLLIIGLIISFGVDFAKREVKRWWEKD
jgi:hypothetical protein